MSVTNFSALATSMTHTHSLYQLAKFLTAAIAALALLAGLAFAARQEVIVIDDFRSGISPKWREKKFSGQTQYVSAKKDNQMGVMATSSNAASGLFYTIDYAPKNYPVLEWSWQIDSVLATGDARSKKGDDYAARIYVVFPDTFFWRTKALNYVWANKLPKGEFRPSSYTANSTMIAVQSGNSRAGEWITEQRNILEDYKRAFGGQPPNVGSIAIMTDTDNTGEKATAWYGPITIKSRF